MFTQTDNVNRLFDKLRDELTGVAAIAVEAYLAADQGELAKDSDNRRIASEGIRACQETMLAIIDTYTIQGLKYQILAQPGPDPQPVQGENFYE